MDELSEDDRLTVSLGMHAGGNVIFGCNSHTGTPREFAFQNPSGAALGMLVHAGFKDGPPNPNSAYRFRQQSDRRVILEYEDGAGDGDFNDCVIEMTISD